MPTSGAWRATRPGSWACSCSRWRWACWHSPGRPWLGLLFLAVYGLYVKRELTREEECLDCEDLEPLKLRPRDPSPSLFWACTQTVLALAVIALASHVFVRQIELLGLAMGASPHVAALLLAPVATELPEIMNALIWVRQGKERLALANISGAMMIQATIPSALGIFLTPWLLDAPLLAAGGFTLAAILLLWLRFRRAAMSVPALSAVGGLYALFAGYLGWHFYA